MFWSFCWFGCHLDILTRGSPIRIQADNATAVMFRTFKEEPNMLCGKRGRRNYFLDRTSCSSFPDWSHPRCGRLAGRLLQPAVPGNWRNGPYTWKCSQSCVTFGAKLDADPLNSVFNNNLNRFVSRWRDPLKEAMDALVYTFAPPKLLFHQLHRIEIKGIPVIAIEPFLPRQTW